MSQPRTIQTPPQAVIISGPNGSGKSTAATTLLPPDMVFVNADMIASTLTGKPGTPGDINAGRILVDRIQALEQNRQDFAFETTLATKMLTTRVRSWRDSGYEVNLVYFWLQSEELAVARVESRVRAGGHLVPEPTIRRRYQSGLRLLFQQYMPLVDTWRLFDNSEAHPRLIARGSHNAPIRIEDVKTWDNLNRTYGK